MSLIITKIAHISDIKFARVKPYFIEARTPSNIRNIPILEV